MAVQPGATGQAPAASNSIPADAFPGDWNSEDERELEARLNTDVWEKRNPARPISVAKYWPDWTDPSFTPDIEFSFDGLQQRPASYGGEERRLRPAILPLDRADGPTKYALRWGVHASRERTAANQSRSKMTPTSAVFNAGTGADTWTEDDSYQASVLSGLTTRELTESGVYEPDHVLEESDLNTDIHALLGRDRWTQDPIPSCPAHKIVDGPVILNSQYNLGGRQGFYDAQNNQDIWDALAPSLRIATAVLNANPAPLDAMLNFTETLRKVPIDVDGRTDDQKAAPDYRQFRSLWLPDSNPVPGYEEYDAARALRALGFKSGKATMALLLRDVRLSIICGAVQGLAASYDDGTGHVVHRICINADHVWPLLVPDFTNAEKVSYRLNLAQTLLHEIIHCCRYAHNEMLFNPRDVQQLANRDFELTDEMCTRLQELKDEIHGPGGDPLTRWTIQYFFQDEHQLEEGKGFDNQIWGGDGAAFPPIGPGTFAPVLQNTRWPWTHPAVELQGQGAVAGGDYGAYASGDSYTTYLLNPPASAYNFAALIPLEAYEGFLRTSWWESDFRKYGMQGLKMTSDVAGRSRARTRRRGRNLRGPEAPLHFIPSLLVHGNAAVGELLFLAFPAFSFLTMALEALTRDGHHLLADSLQDRLVETVMPELEEQRLSYESLTWPRTYDQEIGGLATQAANDFRTMEKELQAFVNTLPANRPHMLIRALNARLDGLVQVLMELRRRIMYHILQYAQAVVGTYYLQPFDRRAPIRPHMVKLRTHLTPLRTLLAAIQMPLTSWTPTIFRSAANGRVFQLQDAPNVGQFLRSIAAQDANLDVAQRTAINADIAHFTMTALAAVRDMATPLSIDLGHFDDVLCLLSDEALATDVPVAGRAGLQLNRAQRLLGPRAGGHRLRLAAQKELLRIGDKKLLRMVAIWFRTVNNKLGP